jgi:hypothetical protein
VIEEISPAYNPRLRPVPATDVAVSEPAIGSGWFLCIPVEEQCAPDEFATVKTDENAFASEIKNLSLKALAPNTRSLMWSQRNSFLFEY